MKKLKITLTCFGSYEIHHQGVQSCAWLKLLVVIHRYFVVCLVGVWQRNYAHTHTHTKRYAAALPQITSTIKFNDFNKVTYELPEDDLNDDRNMLESF